MFSLLAASFLAACIDTYPGLVNIDMSGSDVIEDEGLDDTTMVYTEYKLVTVALSNPSYTTLTAGDEVSGGDDQQEDTRSSGSFDSSRDPELWKNLWKSARFYVYSFLNDPSVRFTDNSSTEPKDSTCLLDNVPTYVNDLNSYMLSYVIDDEHDGRHYWSNKDTINRYSFWAYYLDDAEVISQERTEDQISVDFKVDGAHDILSGKAQLTKKQETTIKNSGDKYLRSYYSTYTARRDLFPVVRLKHQMARLKFRIYPGNETSGGYIIDSIRVVGPSKAHLTVVSHNDDELGCEFYGDRIWYSLHDKDNSPTLEQDRYIVEWKPEYAEMPTYERDYLDVGESLLIPPAERVRIQIFCRQYDETVGDYVNPLEYSGSTTWIGFQPGFEAGHSYTIRIVLYGSMMYSADALLTGWAMGEDIFVDSEEDDFKRDQDDIEY